MVQRSWLVWVFASLSLAGACGGSGSNAPDDTAGASGDAGSNGVPDAGTGAGGARAGGPSQDGAGAGNEGGTNDSNRGGASGSIGEAGASDGGTHAAGVSGEGGNNISGGASGTPNVPTRGAWTRFSLGDQQTCAITEEGELYCWGFQDSQQPLVGDGTVYTRSRPVRVGGDGGGWHDVGAGVLATCALRNGEVWCWGMLPEQGTRSPVRIGTHADWEAIDTGRSYGCGIRAGGSIECWGAGLGFEAATGSGLNMSSLEPLPLSSASDLPENSGFELISVGRQNGCGIRQGELYCWGSALTFPSGPTRIGTDTDWETVSAGDEYACAIRGGDLYCWGEEQQGEFGNGMVEDIQRSPVPVTLQGGWTHVAASTRATCGVRLGELYCWGYGPLGFHSNLTAYEPTRVGDRSDWEEVRLGYHGCARRGGELYCWGTNGDGELGGGIAGIHATPQEVASEEPWESIVPGYLHTCGIQAGSVWCFGDIPVRPQGIAATPALVSGETDWRKLTLGYQHTCGLRSDRAWCWGSNGTRLLGTGDGMSYIGPVPVGPAGEWTDIATGFSRTCGIREGELYCWGENTIGLLGDGTTERRDVPTRIGTAADWTSVVVGPEHTCGLRSEKLFCWGRNLGGQVGTGNDEIVREPIQVEDADWTKLALGSPTCGIQASSSSSGDSPSGSLYCWGPSVTGMSNFGGPIRMGLHDDWTDIAVSPVDSVCGIRNAGELYCWGRDYIGQLPTAAPAYRVDEPIRIGTAKWDNIAVGDRYFCGKSERKAYCWGMNDHLQLGIGPSTSPEPQRVE